MALTHEEKREIEERIIDALRTVYDPEIPVDIYELGLIYEVKIDDNGKADVLMTLTSPSCPVAESLPLEVEEKVRGVEGVTEGKVELTFDPPWDKDMMSEAALLELGFM
jgi:FeS assembly SUF system protein